MNIGVIGSGYVGLITAVGLAEIGHKVINQDIDSEKINKLINCELPFYEENLEKLIQKNTYINRLIFTTDIKYLVDYSDVIFIAVGTPPASDGSADLKYIYQCADDIAKNINNYKIIVIKSTVPPGTCKKIEDYLKEKIAQNNKKIEIDVVSNPEFLREGNAIYDFFYPDRIIIGTSSYKVQNVMRQIYEYFENSKVEILFTDRESSELIKYSSNAFLATKISFINELSILCENIGANIKDVSKGIGLDKRIGNKFLEAGPGYGGSCFPKDTSALYNFAVKKGVNLSIVESTIKANNNQINYAIEKIIKILSPIEGRIVNLLGLTFKPNTDDIRESPSIYIIKSLLKSDVYIKAYCPKGMPKAKKIFENEPNIVFCENIYESFVDSEGCIIVTDWEDFKNIDINLAYQLMKSCNLIDLRNIFYSNDKVKSLFNYYGLGVPANKNEVYI